MAVTDLAAVITTVQVFPDVESQPLQFVKVEPPAAVGVRVTDVPVVYEAEHVLGQVIPDGELVTVPAPVPASLTFKVKLVDEQGFVADAVFRGVGEPTLKSVELLSVSVQPALALSTALVLLGAEVGADPSKQFAVVPNPTKSTTAAPNGHPPPVNAVVVLVNATFPAVALMLMLPMASGVGRFVVPPAPAASWIR